MSYKPKQEIYDKLVVTKPKLKRPVSSVNLDLNDDEKLRLLNKRQN